MDRVDLVSFSWQLLELVVSLSLKSPPVANAIKVLQVCKNRPDCKINCNPHGLSNLIC